MKFRSFLAVALVLLLFEMLPACSPEPANSGKWINCGDYTGVFSEEGYYYSTLHNCLYFLDVDNGINACLCSKIACPHDSDPDSVALFECEARVNTFGSFDGFFWNDGLYYIETDAYGTHLYKRNADGTGLQLVMTLCEKYLKEQKSVNVYASYCVDGYMYYRAEVNGSIKTESGTMIDTEKILLVRTDLRAKKEEEILSATPDVDLQICGLSGDGIIYSKMVMPRNSDHEDYREELHAAKIQLIHLDLNTGEGTLLMEKIRSEDFYVLAVVGNEVLYAIAENGQTVVRTLDLHSGKDTLAYTIKNLVYINEDFGLRMDEETEIRYFVDLKTGKDLPTAFAGQSIHVQNVSGEGVILTRGVRGEGNSIKSRIYFYVSFESLKDGLQEEDAVNFYIRGRS